MAAVDIDEETAEALEELSNRVDSMLERLDAMRRSGMPEPSGEVALTLRGRTIKQSMTAVRRKVERERLIVDKMLDGRNVATLDKVKSSNVGALETLLECAEKEMPFAGLLVAFPVADTTVHVDVVSGDGQRWYKTKAMNPKTLHDVYCGRGRHSQETLQQQARDLVAAAHSFQQSFGCPKVIYTFAHGVSVLAASKLESVGVVVEGERLDLPGEPEWESSYSDDEGGGDELECGPGHTATSTAAAGDTELQHADPNLVNLDVSTIIALVSDVSNGGATTATYENDRFLESQAVEEAENPLLPRLQEYLHGKRLIACATAVSDAERIVGIVGGERENARLVELLGKVEAVPDAPSDRLLGLNDSTKVTRRSKVIFGTGETMRAVTCTANVAFVRAAQEQKVTFATFTHEARALSEAKDTNVEGYVGSVGLLIRLDGTVGE